MVPDKRPGFFSTLARAAQAEDALLPDDPKDASGTDWRDAATDSTQPATVDDDPVLEEEAPRRALTPAQAAAVQAAAAASRAARRGVPDTNISPTASPRETSQTASSPPAASPANASPPTITSPGATSPGALSDEVVAARDPASQDFSSQSAASQSAASQVRSTQTQASRVATAQNESKAPAEEASAEKARGAKSGRAGRLRVALPARPAISPRVLTALVGIPIVLLIVWLGGAWLVGVTLFLALVAMRELVVAARRNRTPLVIELSYPLLLIVFFSALRIGTHLRPEPAARLVATDAQPSFFTAFALLAVYAALLALLVFAIARYAKPKPVTLISVALTILSVLYVSLLAFLPLVQGTGHGRHLIWIVLLGVWSGDTAAYYAGRAWGRHKLTTLSPGKSREGLWASVLTTTAVCAGLGAASDLGWVHGLALGVVIGVFAPLGDLAESFWKRELNVKDLGSILPGHGGVLDRCDSLMFAAPAAYFYALWHAL